MNDALHIALGFLEPHDALAFGLSSRAHRDLYRRYVRRFLLGLGLPPDVVRWDLDHVPVHVDAFPSQTIVNRGRFLARVRKEPRLARGQRELVLQGLGAAKHEAHAYVCVNSPPPFGLGSDLAVLMLAMEGEFAPPLFKSASVELVPRGAPGVLDAFDGTAVFGFHSQRSGLNSLHGVFAAGMLYPTHDWRADTLRQLQSAARDFFWEVACCPRCRAPWPDGPRPDLCAVCAHFAAQVPTRAMGGCRLKKAREEAMLKRLTVS